LSNAAISLEEAEQSLKEQKRATIALVILSIVGAASVSFGAGMLFGQ
jgi:hypothetical protein